MWWRLALIGGVTAIVLAVLAPMCPVRIEILAPPDMGYADSADPVGEAAQWIFWWLPTAFGLSVVVVAGLLARWIVRKHRKAG
ncbi:hypothetical protein V7S57_07150 [Caulobacter sp. CCNWLY153]|uniref:hypothetical protein n=1 Tax=unclassified Caulobacter TaxID=2648921 RepID=UPI002FF1DB33